jgi:hypothetical protein
VLAKYREKPAAPQKYSAPPKHATPPKKTTAKPCQQKGGKDINKRDVNEKIHRTTAAAKCVIKDKKRQIEERQSTSIQTDTRPIGDILNSQEMWIKPIRKLVPAILGPPLQKSALDAAVGSFTAKKGLNAIAAYFGSTAVA